MTRFPYRVVWIWNVWSPTLATFFSGSKLIGIVRRARVISYSTIYHPLRSASTRAAWVHFEVGVPLDDEGRSSDVSGA